MSINASKAISKPFLKTTNPSVKKWYVCFRYKNSQNQQKEFKRTFNLNQSPFIVNGEVSQKPKILKERLRYGQDLVKELENILEHTEFNVDSGSFQEAQEDNLFTEFLDNWLGWKSNKVKESSLLRYTEKVEVIKNYLISINQENVSLKNFNYSTLNKFLLHLQKTHSNSLYNYYLALFKNIYKYIINIESINVADITKKIEKVKEEDTEKHAKYTDVNKAFTDLTAHNYYLGYMAKTIYYTLHRIDTITQLQFKDFDLVNGIINIPSQKIKTGKKLQIRISKHLLPEIIQYVNEHQPQLTDYFFGHTNNKAMYRKRSILMFGKHRSTVQSFSNLFTLFRDKITTDKKLFTSLHTLYGFKHSGVIYYKNAGLTDHQIIKITGHSNVSILATYSKSYEAIIDEELFNSLP